MITEMINSNSYTRILSTCRDINRIEKLLNSKGVKSYIEDWGNGWVELYVKGKPNGKILDEIVRREACLIG